MKESNIENNKPEQKGLGKTKIFWIAVISLCWILPLQASDDITALLTADQEVVTVGDVVQLKLQVTHPAGYRLIPVQVQMDESEGRSVPIQWGDFEVRSQSRVEIAKEDDGHEVSTQTFGVTLWMTGTFTTPVLPLSVSDLDGNLIELSVEPLAITVDSVLVPGDDELRDIKPQATLPLPPLWPWIAGGVLAFLVASTLFWWLYRRWQARRQSQAPVVIPDGRPAWQIALQELDRIEGLSLPAQYRYKEQYTLVSDVLRSYLEGSYNVPALDRTTAEIRQRLSALTIPPTERLLLLDLLGEADLVKFADVAPEMELAKQLPDQARQLVLALQPVSSDQQPTTNDQRPTL